MRNRTKLVLTALAATLLMATAVSSATANRLSISNKAFRINWTNLKLFGEEAASGVSLACPVTLEGSFHQFTITKNPRTLLGYVSRAAVTTTACTGGRATILTETLPWHVTYEGFTGTLPTITGIRVLLRNLAFQVEILGQLCLYGGAGENAEATINREAGGNVTTVTPNRAVLLRFNRGSIFCPARGGFENDGQVFLLGSNTTRIRITLI